MIFDITTEIKKFHDAGYKDNTPYTRYRSWEHCYEYFTKSNEENTDQACLHLSFYLASWGMYRGSSFLPKYDYKIHETAVKILFNKKYADLRNLKPVYFDDNKINLLFELIAEIKNAYGVENQVSDILVSKIILGTLGCMPAYDRFFKKGFHCINNEIREHQTLNKKNFQILLNWCEKHKIHFNNAQKELDSEVNYPIMKLVDMYFFQVGYNVQHKYPARDYAIQHIGR